MIPQTGGVIIRGGQYLMQQSYKAKENRMIIIQKYNKKDNKKKMCKNQIIKRKNKILRRSRPTPSTKSNIITIKKMEWQR